MNEEEDWMNLWKKMMKEVCQSIIDGLNESDAKSDDDVIEVTEVKPMLGDGNGQ